MSKTSTIEVGLPSDVLRIEGSEGYVAPATRIEDLPGPRGIPVFGNLPQPEPGSLHATLEGWARTYGPLFGIRLRSLEAVGVAEPR